jgi:hypothetical protein
MNVCPDCGTRLNSLTRFCPGCGIKVIKDKIQIEIESCYICRRKITEIEEIFVQKGINENENLMLMVNKNVIVNKNNIEFECRIQLCPICSKLLGTTSSEFNTLNKI